MNRFFLLCTIVLAFTGCIKPVALIEADLDPKINLQKNKGSKYISHSKTKPLKRKNSHFIWKMNSRNKDTRLPRLLNFLIFI